MPSRNHVSLLTAALVAVAWSAPSQAQQMPDVGEQMARMSGSLHFVARECGEATDAELAEAKRLQEANHGKFGMDPATFEPGFDAGEAKAAANWETMSPARRRQACVEIKQQWKDVAQALGVGPA